MRKGDLFVWARVRRLRRESVYVYKWRMFDFMSVVVTVWGSVGMSVV